MAGIKNNDSSNIQFSLGNKSACALLVLFFLLLLLAIFLSNLNVSDDFKLLTNLYKSGSLVFGGGHVILPLLENDFVTTGLLGKDQFLAGYGAAQAIPGPLFAFVSFCGTLLSLPNESIWLPGAIGIICLIVIYIPTFLLIPSALCFWSRIRLNPRFMGAFSGINASIFALLAHAFVSYIVPFCFESGLNILLVFIGFLMLGALKLPSWSVVLVVGSAGWAFTGILV